VCLVLEDLSEGMKEGGRAKWAKQLLLGKVILQNYNMLLSTLKIC
jgi:hypothetical protein